MNPFFDYLIVNELENKCAIRFNVKKTGCATHDPICLPYMELLSVLLISYTQFILHKLFLSLVNFPFPQLTVFLCNLK